MKQGVLDKASGRGSLAGTFLALVLIGFFARLSYSIARTPVLPLFAKFLGASTVDIGFIVGVPTITGILFKAPAGFRVNLLNPAGCYYFVPTVCEGI